MSWFCHHYHFEQILAKMCSLRKREIHLSDVPTVEPIKILENRLVANNLSVSIITSKLFGTKPFTTLACSEGTLKNLVFSSLPLALLF